MSEKLRYHITDGGNYALFSESVEKYVILKFLENEFEGNNWRPYTRLVMICYTFRVLSEFTIVQILPR